MFHFVYFILCLQVCFFFFLTLAVCNLPIKQIIHTQIVYIIISSVFFLLDVVVFISKILNTVFYSPCLYLTF